MVSAVEEAAIAQIGAASFDTYQTASSCPSVLRNIT